MIKADWNILKAKFSENPQGNFEWFCYLLFCLEFNKPLGAGGYYNHRHIEHNPIEKDSEVIGWQAKFYDTPLSQHKAEMIKMLEGAKKDNPTLTKIIFYTNKNWAQGKNQNDSKVKIEIDNRAKELGITIDWEHMENFFNSPFVSVENELISKNFFTLGKGIYELINEQRKHTENILNEIRTRIEFNGKTIEIERSDVIKKLKSELAQVIVLSGTGGVGKTAVIKKLYNQIKDEISLYIFKATEFELRNINDFFKDFDFQEFLDAHKYEKYKIIVIDSAEKLLDLKNADPFKEFLQVLIENKWKIVFTTRENYLNDLNYDFFEIHRIVPLNINLRNLEQTELEAISGGYSFNLPSDYKLLELIKNPFYLNEYLKFYNPNEQLDYESFRNGLWDRNIKKSKPAREQCFLKIASERANEGQFYLNPDCESNILHEFVNDGILGYETEGYFITHDIYEEWALEKKIEVEFNKRTGNNEFYGNIGKSLPVRRSFRSWVSRKLLLEDGEIKKFIEEIINDKDIEPFWKDEILISVLLSNYSEHFFKIFKDSLLENKQQLLRRLTFLLRIACKEVDIDFFAQLGIKNVDLFTLKYVMTKPKGYGWNSIIKFVYENLNTIGIENLYFMLPVINDWNSKFKTGITTRYSGLIALQYYQWTINKDVLYSLDNDVKEQLLQTILYGSSEIKDELGKILEEIVKNKWKNHRNLYYDLSKTILTKTDAIPAVQVFPEQILQLADLFWTHTPRKEDGHFGDYRSGVEQYFNLEDDHHEYHPASAFKTPIYWLLQSSLIKTIDFILDFTNKSVEAFAKSHYGSREVIEINVFVDDGKYIKQYICDRIWCMYRGTQVNSNVLGSMHMALESYLLENAKYFDSKTLETLLMYLLIKAKSTSISAIVSSIVMAVPNKTFNVAKVLFQTKEFILWDNRRWLLEQGHKSHLESLQNFFYNSKNDIYENERIKACDDTHRKLTLENLFFNYQFFRDEKTAEKDAEAQQKELWKILDSYYSKLPPEAEQTNADETWRFCLARIDRRKMKPTTEKTDKGILIHFNPEIEPKLKQKSEESLKEISANWKYTALDLWSRYKIDNDERSKDYQQYENDPLKALDEVKEIIKQLSLTEKKSSSQDNNTRDTFDLFNHSTPGNVCAVLIRDYYEQLTNKERNYCKSILLDATELASSPDYNYQAMDSTKSAILVLPYLLDKYPKENEKIKEALLYILFNRHTIDMAGTGFNSFAVMAIHNLWDKHYEDAMSILIAYLMLEPVYDEVRKKLRREKYEKQEYNVDESEVRERFMQENKKIIQKFKHNQLSMDDIVKLESTDLNTLKTAFQMIPFKNISNEQKNIVQKIIIIFVKKLILQKKDSRNDYYAEYDFREKFAYFILSAPIKEILGYLQPLLDNFNDSEFFVELFTTFIYAQDRLNEYEKFWLVWDLFKEKVLEICSTKDNYYSNKIIKSYLFAKVAWKETTSEWHTLKANNMKFFKEMAEKIGHSPATLYSISRLLNNIGEPYLNEGVELLSSMLIRNPNLQTAKLETNTIYYIEKLIRKFIYYNKQKIKITKRLKDQTLIILDYLITKGSVMGYILRESII